MISRVMESELSRKIIGAAIEVHRILGGPGLLESVYEAALFHELTIQGHQCQRQLPIPIKYKAIVIRDPLILDILVDNKVIVEVKATEQDHPIHQTQLLTYLRLSGIKLGLLLNFGKKQLKEGISRLIN